MKTVLFLHGWGGSGAGHWQNVLAERLKAAGVRVIFPRLPDADNPHLEDWILAMDRALENAYASGGAASELKIATYSLGGALMLHYMARKKDFLPEKVFLVAPPLNDCGIEEIKDFFPLPDLDLSRFGGRFLLIHSDNDSYIPLADFEEFARRFRVPVHFIPNAGHINTKAGFGDWDFMFECLSA